MAPLRLPPNPFDRWARSESGLHLPSRFVPRAAKRLHHIEKFGQCQCCCGSEPIACCNYCNSSPGTITPAAYATIYIPDDQGWDTDCGTCTNFNGQTFELPFYECTSITYPSGVTYCRAYWRDEFDFAVCGETHIYVQVVLSRHDDTPTFNYYNVTIRKDAFNTGDVIVADSFGSNSKSFCDGFNIGWRSGYTAMCYSFNETSVVDFYS